MVDEDSAEPHSVSVVVPTRNSSRTLDACLKSIKSQSTCCTLIVVDNGSEDGTLEIAQKYADVIISRGPERSAQRNAGASLTESYIVGFVDSDMILSPGVVGEVVGAIRNGAVSVIIPERTIGVGFWANVRAFERDFYRGSDDIEAPRFFLRSVFDAVGGFDENITGPEDWDLGMRVQKFGKASRIVADIDHDEGHVRYLAACKKKAYYAQGIECFLKKHGNEGFDRLSSRPWLSEPRKLASVLGMGLLALKSGEGLAVISVLLRNKIRERIHQY